MSKRRFGWPPVRPRIGDLVTCQLFWNDGRIGKVIDEYIMPRSQEEWMVVDWKWLSHPGLLLSHHHVEDLSIAHWAQS